MAATARSALYSHNSAKTKRGFGYHLIAIVSVPSSLMYKGTTD